MRVRKVGIKKLLIALIFIAAIAAGWLVFSADKAEAPNNQTTNQVTAPKEPDAQKADGFRIFSGEEFFKLYDSFAYPNTQLISEHSPITGNEEADSRIRKLALEKGYKLRSAPVTNNFVEVQKDMLLQQRAAQPWLDLKANAKANGLALSLSDAFRSAEDQRTIFMQRLIGIPPEAVASGSADAQVSKVLEKTALPGYSRHHSGYTVDIVCDNNPSVKFEKSSCFAWLSKDNYINAKKHGWIPSYPEGIAKQGPEPESWEYVLVGTDALR